RGAGGAARGGAWVVDAGGAGGGGMREMANSKLQMAKPGGARRSSGRRRHWAGFAICSLSSCYLAATAVAAVALGTSDVLREEGSGTDLEAKLAAIEERGEQVEDLTARFEQHKHTALLREPMVSSGTVKVRAGRVLWETKEPRRSMMGIDQTRAIVLYPQQKAAEIYPLRGEMQLLGASPLPRIATLREAFEISETDATDLL